MSLNTDKTFPILRESDLDDTSTFFDIILAAPSDDKLVIYWAMWAFLALACAVLVLVFMLALMCSPPETRKQAFNMYVMFLMFPI